MTSFRIRTQVDLKHHTYYQIGGMAHYFAEPSSFFEVQWAMKFARDHKLPAVTLGTGSNSLYSDQGFPGLVISLAQLKNFHWLGPEYLWAQAGLSNTEVAELAYEAQRMDAAWMYRMPGQLGSSVRMNAKCFGGETQDIVVQVGTMDAQGKLKVYSAQEIFKGYKDTHFMHHPELILWVLLHLPTPGTFPQIAQKMQECENARWQKHHFDFPSCGSTFKNNYQAGRPSGAIFDSLGFKCKQVGMAQVSQHHANFIWNLGGAKASEVLSLASEMKRMAQQKQNIELHLEVQPIGPFVESEFRACAMETLGSWSQSPQHGAIAGVQWDFHSHSSPEHPTFPLLHMCCPFVPYERTQRLSSTAQPNPSPPLPSAWIQMKISQLCPLQEALSSPLEPFLRWEVTGEGLEELLHRNTPCQSLDEFQDGLWQDAVAELFVSHPAHPQTYLELEFALTGESLALTFEDVRKRSPRQPVKSDEPWKRMVPDWSPSQLRVEIPLEVLKPYMQGQNLRLQGMLSYPQNGLWQAPYLSLGELEKPDFHQPHRFWELSLAP